MSPPPLTPLAAAVLHVGEPERILQIECGEGEGALFLAREFPSARVRGIDRDAEAIRGANSRVGLDPEGRIAFKQGSPASTPFPDDHFDLLVAVDTWPAVREADACCAPAASWRSSRRPASGRRAASAPGICGGGCGAPGFEPIWEEAAGDGSFAVARLRGGGPVGGSL